jgi:hypothetical protein
MARNLEIKSAKVKNGTHLQSTYTESEVLGDGSIRRITRPEEMADSWVHKDLLEGFKALVKHLVVLTEYHTREQIEQRPELLDSFVCTGIILGGEGDEKGVQLMGRKNLKGGHVNNLLTRFVKFHPDHEHEYKEHAPVLQEETMKVIAESYLCITGVKLGINPQGSLFGDKAKPKKKVANSDVTDDEVAPSEETKPKGKSRKLHAETA